MEHLRRGIEANPTDADVLIAMYRVSDPGEPWRKEVTERIETAVKYFQDRIAEARGQIKELQRAGVDEEQGAVYRAYLASGCNQLAWLVSNTQGDFREALRCSQESLQIVPDEAGFLDTLGRCYYALGDFENAVKHQARAVELEPHSGQLARQLELFRTALAQTKKEARDE
jgi:tetratricopeptide (TPR) repeat protein